MKKSAFLLLCFALLACGMVQTHGQETNVKTAVDTAVEEEDRPIMFKFEPDYLLSVADRKKRIRLTRTILDTLDISEGKRRRLLKELYKNGVTERLAKAMLADSKFEDEEQE